MATSLAAQLSRISAASSKSLNLKAQKNAHSQSLIFAPTIAASQSFETIYTLCHEGFQELCLLDGRYLDFQRNLFSEASQAEDRTQMTAGENAELNKRLEAFLGLVGARLRLTPAIKAVEWLVRRFRIHEYNTAFLLMTFLPYHTLPIFTTLLSILPAQIPETYKFLHPYIRSLTQPPRHVIVHGATNNATFNSLFNSYVLRICKARQQYQALLSFWAGIMTEAISGMIDKSRSGRSGVQSQNEQDILFRILPTLNEGLSMKKVPELRIGCYMLLAVMASKGNLDDKILAAMMDAVVLGWTVETQVPAVLCISGLAQHRSAVQLPNRSAKELLKLDGLPALLAELSKSRRIEKLAYGICLAAIDRFGKTGDASMLSTLQNLVESELLTSSQATASIKALLLIANEIDFTTETFDTARTSLGDLLVSFGQASGRLGTVIHGAIKASGLDIDQLEMKLQTAFRPKEIPAPPADDSDNEDAMMLDKEEGPTFAALYEKLPIRTAKEVSFLCPKPSPLFEDLCEAFLLSIANSNDTAHFAKSPVLRPESVLTEALYISFFARIWCGPYPVLAREAALHIVVEQIKSAKKTTTDLQAVIPYVVAALGDPAPKVRRSAAELLVAVAGVYGNVDEDKKKQKAMTQWGFDDIYGNSGETQNTKWLPIDAVTRFIRETLVPNLEECVLDRNHIASLFDKSLNSVSKSLPSVKKNEHGFSQALRASIISFFASHVVNTPLYLVKLRLLHGLNKVHGVANTPRTKVLLPILQRWASLDAIQAHEICDAEKLRQNEVDEEITAVVVANDKDGLDCLISIAKLELAADRSSLIAAVFRRIRKLWSSFKSDMMVYVAQALLDISQSTANLSEAASFAQGEAMNLLRTLPLSTEVLASFLNQLPTVANMVDAPPASKKRRTSHGEVAKLGLQDTELFKKSMKKVTFVLQLIEGSNASQHPELLKGLFNNLAELQHFKTQIGSELGFLQVLVLTSLLSIVKAHKSDKSLILDRSGVRADLLVDCIQKSTSPQVQNEALLLVSSLADTAPELVLHSVMPIFTFMGNSVLRQNDEYSAHVIDQTIRQVIPPLISSLRKDKKDPVLGAAELLLSFTAAYEHVPPHRRQGLFISLVQTLGAEDFLYALLAMLADKYGAADDIRSFAVELASHFGVEIQLQTASKYLDLVTDVLKSKPAISNVLLGLDDSKDVDRSHVAHRLLRLLPHLLAEKRMVQRTAKILSQDDMDSARIRDIYSSLLEQILALADALKQDKSLHAACGDVLESLLGLLSISEFVKSVENLLDKPNEELRRKILISLQVRIDQESQSDQKSRSALLGFLPQLTAIIRNSTDLLYKRTAVTCVDNISKKYGKKDLEAVAAAAETIASQHCLGQTDDSLRRMALLCLTSLVEILGEHIVSVLPAALPKALEYMAASMQEDTQNEKLHNAGFSFFSALVEYLPYMVTGVYLEQLLSLSNTSAATEFSSDADENRTLCLRITAKQVDAKSMFVALEKNFEHAAKSGVQALGEYFEILTIVVEKHTKAVVTKHSSLLTNIVLSAFDLRRQWSLNESESPEAGAITAVEKAVNDVAIKMIFKYNDSTFRPIFSKMVEWAASSLPKKDKNGRIMRLQSLYAFTSVFFDNLKSIVTSYAAYILDNAVDVLKHVDPKDNDSRELWSRVLQTLHKSFSNDQDDFWQSPSHFSTICPILISQFNLASTLPLEEYLIPAVVELAAAADSADHHKELNTSILKHFRSENKDVRLAAVKCQNALTEKLGEDWLGLLPEMLPLVGELQDDDDEGVEREVGRWILRMEGILGESLDEMLK